MESSQAHKDLFSLLKIQESCSTESGYGILLFFTAGRQISISLSVFTVSQRCPALQTPALFQRHRGGTLLNRGTSYLACSRIQNSSLTLSPMSVFKMSRTLPTKIPAHLGFFYPPVPSVHF